MELWGHSLGFWQSVVFWSIVISALAGSVGITAAFVSALVGYNVSNVVQKDADIRISEANARAAEAMLRLERHKERRRLTSQQFAVLVEKLKPFAGTEFDLSAIDDEQLDLALDVERALTASGWTIRSWTLGGNVTTLPGRRFFVGHVVLGGGDVQMRDPGLLGARDALFNVLTLAGFEGVRGSGADAPPGFRTEAYST